MHSRSQVWKGPRSPGLGPRSRALQLVLNWLVFGLCYPLANLLAREAGIQRSIALDLDAHMPFLPWMIVPYMSSGLLFTLVFFLVRTPEQLRVASRRLLLATVLGCLVFALAPTRFSMVRPALEGLPALLFGALELADEPYNQLPSLHVAYCLIIWLALRGLCRGAARALLAAWLLLVAASTVFTWQHHLLDVAGGLLLGVLCAHLVQPGATARRTVAFHYALAAGVLLLVGVAWLRSVLLAYAAASLLCVALAYARRRPDLLLKRDGRHTPAAWLLYWPYLAGYRLTWALVLLRGRPAFVQARPGVWFGRRLTSAEARLLPPDCQVIDLCAELSETPALRGPRYRGLPLLDMQAPGRRALREVLRAVEEARRGGRPVYVHCAMGYSRSRLIARLHNRHHEPCRSPSTN